MLQNTVFLLCSRSRTLISTSNENNSSHINFNDGITKTNKNNDDRHDKFENYNSKDNDSNDNYDNNDEYDNNEYYISNISFYLESNILVCLFILTFF